MPTNTPELQNIVAEDSPFAASRTSGAPLCVDLDGTLVKSDTLVDSVLFLARHRPAALKHLPGWLAQGKAALKRHVTQAVKLDVDTLPYNQPLLQYLRGQFAEGRAIYLATAADTGLAERVAAHLGIFSGVLASDGATNLAGGNKLAAFRQAFGDDFTYIGNALPDAPILAVCRSPMVANPDRALLARLRRSGIEPTQTFTDRAPALRGWLRAVRLHQWSKNVLIFVPLLLAHRWTVGAIAGGIVAFFSFGFCASATYIVNDLLDVDADRKHPRKRHRPFAAGDIPATTGVAAIAVLMLLAIALAIVLPRVVLGLGGPDPHLRPWFFAEWLAVYTVSTLSYSLYLKRKVLVDVFVLSGLYTVRILAGSAATVVPISTWLGGFSLFFFLSLAFVKRFSELEALQARGGISATGRGYHVVDVEQLRALGTGAAYSAVVVMMFYISTQANQLYRHPVRLWLAIPVLLLWLSQIWLRASRGEMHDDPVVYAITNRRSLLLGLMAAVVIWSAL